MSSDTVELAAKKREVTGKKVAKLRAEGQVPATLYEKGKESINVSVPYMPLIKAYQVVGQNQPVNLVVDGKEYLTMIKDAHVDPVRNEIVHVAFHAVDKNKPVEADIPVHLEGDSPGVLAGNFINRPNDTVTVKAKPSDLPEVLNVNIEGLENPGDSVTIADIAALDNVEFVSDPSTSLAVLEEPRVQEEPEEEEEPVDAADVPSEKGGDKPEGEGDDKTEGKDEKSN